MAAFPPTYKCLKSATVTDFFLVTCSGVYRVFILSKNSLLPIKAIKWISFPDEALLPPSLIRFSILTFQNLKLLNSKGLQHLSSLQELSINRCNNLVSLPEEGWPASLSFLYIDNCCKLKPCDFTSQKLISAFPQGHYLLSMTSASHTSPSILCHC
ncbi:hypothetical protein CMV_017746 [Castanea mollissima]|uniref:Uncharacterized protein n=1 Tax=Castanea mollissima TaxID=60419 RepID=A0A8J4VQB3_9ROSI|nr:hypothetical protein CMV_017746 [Castanea mollissima]